jgi:hypothetical protein
MSAKNSKKEMAFFGAALFAAVLVVSVAAFLPSRSRSSLSKDSTSFSEAPPVTSNMSKKVENNSLSETQEFVDKEKLKESISHMEQYGAEGAIAIHAKDEKGNPIGRASVRLDFTQPDQDWRAGIVEGETDEIGFFGAKRTSNWACIWSVSKDGYHSSRGKVLFTHKGSQRAFLKGQWTDEPIDVEVVLKKVSGAKFVHGRRYNDIVFLPTNSWVGFDFTMCDLVEPHGSGKNPHILLRSESDGVSPFCKGATPGYTNVLHIKVADGGLSVETEAGESQSPFISLVPSSLRTNLLTFVYARTKDAILIDNRPSEKDYIVFKTNLSTSDGTELFCGIIKNIEFFPGQLRLEYFFNRNSGDMRLDADESSPLDIGK